MTLIKDLHNEQDLGIWRSGGKAFWAEKTASTKALGREGELSFLALPMLSWASFLALSHITTPHDTQVPAKSSFKLFSTNMPLYSCLHLSISCGKPCSFLWLLKSNKNPVRGHPFCESITDNPPAKSSFSSLKSYCTCWKLSYLRHPGGAIGGCIPRKGMWF